MDVLVLNLRIIQGTSSERQHYRVAGSLVMGRDESVVLLFKIRVLFNHPLYHSNIWSNNTVSLLLSGRSRFLYIDPVSLNIMLL